MNNRTPTPAGLTRLALALTLLLVLLATVFRGGNRAVALMGLEWLALALLLACALPWLGRASLPAGWGTGRWAALRLALASAPLVVAVVQLVPWPGAGALSPTPLATAYALLAGLPVVACFMVALSGNAAQVQTLLRLWLWVAVAQAALGLLQLGGFDALYFGMNGAEPVIGSYASKNTYANLLAMAAPLAVLGLWGASGRQRRGSGSHGERRSPWWSVLALLTLLAAALASTSRTGIATALLVTLLALALLAPARESATGGRGAWLRRLGLPALALGLLAVALFMGGLDWVERFDADRLAEDDAVRALTREATWQGALAYWPVGSGLGSYAWVFPRFQAPEVGPYLLDLAHNDYLQILMETGALGLVAMALTLALMGRRALQLFSAGRGTWSSADRLAVACGLGLLATLLHAWVDYPFRIPANAMLAAFLLGVFLRQPVTPVADPQKVKSRTYV
ncbi:O-antigen ligase family protein [Hydrogenophaga aromaticivorans]|uniref:O-antigen ligase family protein n=1 Tax=Hydrogenophaga aromaticivorans TaxID=2610898 RepID=UPI001B397E59|nr:O-antigen ligase family protein [Hydrogenophaga aromaticivorans]MBQ0921625.1 O-antigen ligase family protein [Hydrogenophaga aromaticivorans]